MAAASGSSGTSSTTSKPFGALLAIAKEVFVCRLLFSLLLRVFPRGEGKRIWGLGFRAIGKRCQADSLQSKGTPCRDLSTTPQPKCSITTSQTHILLPKPPPPHSPGDLDFPANRPSSPCGRGWGSSCRWGPRKLKP